MQTGRRDPPLRPMPAAARSGVAEITTCGYRRFMMADADVFALSSEASIRLETIGGAIPIILVDNLYQHPDAVRRLALELPYAPPPYPYPGKLAEIPEPNPSLSRLRHSVLDLVNNHYLPRVPPIAQEGRRISSFRQLHTDFAVVDLHPDELSAGQRIPHTDPCPIFALVYLSREDRGGTMFFRQIAEVGDLPGGAYPSPNQASFEFVGRIEAAFNRLAIYPGFVPHSAEISGDWIRGDERFAQPRLTQRMALLP